MIAGVTPAPDLSQQYVLECTAASAQQTSNYASSCGGGIVDDALKFIAAHGIPTETAYPYISSTYTSSTGFPTTPGICTPTSSTVLKETTLAGLFKTYNGLTNAQLKDILTYAPMTILIYATTQFQSYTGGVYSGCPAVTTSSQINHAVLAIGYDTNGNYIIKNSWGTSWGQNGYGVISKNFDCGANLFPSEIRGNQKPLYGTPLYAAILMAIFVFLGIM